MAVIEKNGNWWVDTYINGRRIRRKIGPDEETAKLAEMDLKVRAAKGEWLGIEQTKRMTFAEFCKEFMSKQAGKAENTIRSYDKTIRCHLVPFFGRLHLTDIRRKHVEDFVQERAGVAQHSTVNRELQQLKAILYTALRWNHLKENPAKGVKPLRLPEKEPPYLTRDQVAPLYEACDGWLHTFVAIALNTGLRISEILALKWEDIDTRNRAIKVRSDEEFTTKGRRNRAVPINDFLARALHRQPRHITCPFVIYNNQGRSPESTGVRYQFAKALKRAGLPHFRIHDMRHTFGTTLAANGVDVRTIQELMGHRDVTTTMRYLHAAPERMRGAVENLALDGTTQAEIEAEEDRKARQVGQDLDTGTLGQK